MGTTNVRTQGGGGDLLDNDFEMNDLLEMILNI